MDERFNNLIKDRKNFIDSAIQNKSYDGLKNLLINQYPDNAHFIYELLQNAEDPEATTVTFSLNQKELNFEHNGIRKFQFEDIESITNIGNSTKNSDLTSIGKFGIGFKAVYTYTHTPVIHSGDYHFQIDDMMIPKIINNSFPIDDKTRFNFPFNHNNKKSEVAYKEVREGLLGVQDISILFLKNITKIEIHISDNEYHIIEKKKLNDNFIEIVHKINNILHKKSNWLLYHKDVELSNESNPNSSLKYRVSLAYNLKFNNDIQNLEISNEQNGKVFIFFPAEKETFLLNFHVNAPFASPVSRSSILDTDENIKLIQNLSELFCESIFDLKNKGLLIKEAFKLFPIDMNKKKGNKYYNYFYESTKKVLVENEFLLTTKNTYSTSDNLLIAEDEIVVKLFKEEQLFEIFSERKIWIDKIIVSIPEFKKFLKEDLKISSINLRGMIEKLNDQFFTKQSDEWLIEFYTQLSNPKLEHLWKIKKDLPTLLQKSFIRLENNQMVRPFNENKVPCAYLNQNSISTSFPIVKKSLTNNKKAIEFLRKLDLGNVDEFAELTHNILPLYSRSDEKISLEEHISHMKIIQKCFSADSEKKINIIRKNLEEIRFIRNSKGKYNKPNELYFLKPELVEYFEGNQNITFIDSIYFEDQIKIFKNLGVSEEVRVSFSNYNISNNFITLPESNGYKRGINGFDPYFNVDGLEEAVKNITLQKSKFIWNNILIKYSYLIKGIVQSSNQKSFYPNFEETIESYQFGKLLLNSKWLPKTDGKFYFPKELKFSDLPEGFHKDENIILQLNMKNDIGKLAMEAGVSVESIHVAQKLEKLLPQDREKISNQIGQYFFKTTPQFPSNKVNNPDLRENKTKLQYLNEEEKTYQESIRSNRSSTTEFDPKEYLYINYTNSEEQLICQICKLEMPFKKRDGRYYFEKKEIFTKTFFNNESHIPYLALCPVCAAKYQEFIKSDETKLQKLKKSILESDLDEVNITLGEESTSIKFVDRHFFDLKSILKEVNR